MARTRTETRARARALQALYAWDVRGDQRLDVLAEQLWDELNMSPEERRRADVLLARVIHQREEIDGALRDVTTNWRLDRLGAIERSVLRLGAAELALGDTPAKVVIQEAVNLAERYGSAQSARFVNGVLDALARRQGRL
ncbi:MAG TPA: transcription antitermination factor NusB [Gemmatimonadaceae bacterium]|nr:transcription antitermination factor NusB [Gemmatimonadaceae bacterium]